MKALGNLIPETLKTATATPWIWLYKLILERTTVATAVAFLTAHDEEVTIPRTAHGNDAGDWTGISGNRWTFTCPAGFLPIGFVWFGSTLGIEEVSAVAVDAAHEWHYDTGTRVLTVYSSAGNPVTTYGSMTVKTKETYHPFPVSHETITAVSSGDLPQCRLAFSNLGREFSRYLFLAKGMVGQAVEIRLCHKSFLATADEDAGVYHFEVKGSTVEDLSIVLTLELPDFYQLPTPWDVYSRNRCRWRYKDPLTCGYIGSLPYCDKTLSGPCGCIYHGQDELSAGRPVRHPRLFGGFPGIPAEVG